MLVVCAFAPPLVMASGAGAASRFSIGLGISTGKSIGTLFTLFIVPTFYTFLARDRRPKATVATDPHVNGHAPVRAPAVVTHA